MSVISGLPAAIGPAALPKTSGEEARETALPAKSAEQSGEPSALRVDPGISQLVERAGRVSERTDPESPRTEIAPGNGRYTRFVDAVQALRLDKSDAAELTRERVAELKAAAEEVFNMRGDIPRDERPAEVFEVRRQPEAQPDAVASENRELDQVASQNPFGAEQADQGTVSPGADTGSVDVDPVASEKPSAEVDAATARPTPDPSTIPASDGSVEAARSTAMTDAPAAIQGGAAASYDPTASRAPVE